MPQHTVRSFDEQLKQLKHLIVQMGSLAEEELENAVSALTRRDTALAESTDRAVWELVGSIVATSITAPFLALYSTLLYYDLVARAESPYAGDGHGGPESPPPQP